MKIAKKYSYRHALSIIEREYPSELSEILGILRSVSLVRLKDTKSRSRKGRVVAVKSLSAPGTNERINAALHAKGWEVTPRIISKERFTACGRCQKGEDTG